MRINTRETLLKELRRLKPEFERRYGVTRIGIFGSFARNEIREDSDIDIVVEMQPDLIKRATLKAELESIFGKRIDVVRYRSGMNGFLKKRIDEDAFYV
jgi:predicted nucleotidyltransferase